MMADALNRTTMALKRSVHTPDFPVAEWVINPDLSAVLGEPRRYWALEGDVVSLMTLAERDAVDAAQAQDAIANDRINRADEFNTNRALKAFATIVADELNRLSGAHNDLMAAIGSAASLADIKASVAVLPTEPTRTYVQALNLIKARVGNT